MQNNEGLEKKNLGKSNLNKLGTLTISSIVILSKNIIVGIINLDGEKHLFIQKTYLEFTL